MDAQAEEGALKRLDWRAYRIIHFAVHGLFDADHWTRSSLLLWQNGPSEEDGYLQVRDILPLELASDLVVLSACQTAKAGLLAGEGMTGLSNIFLFRRQPLRPGQPVEHQRPVDGRVHAALLQFAGIGAGGRRGGPGGQNQNDQVQVPSPLLLGGFQPDRLLFGELFDLEFTGNRGHLLVVAVQDEHRPEIAFALHEFLSLDFGQPQSGAIGFPFRRSCPGVRRSG